MVWSDAQSFCRQKYTDLATVVTDNDWMRLNNEVTTNRLTTAAWVGLYNDIDTWRWSYNNVSFKDVLFTRWYTGQPDNNLGKEACGTMGPLTCWQDFSCSDLKPFVCFDGEFNNIQT